MRSSRWNRYARLTAVLSCLALLLAVRAGAQGPRLTTLIAEQQVALWKCQDQRSLPRSAPSVSPWGLPRAKAYRLWVLHLWTQRHNACIKALHARDDAIRSGNYGRLSDTELYTAADAEVRRGGVYSERWGDASPLLKSLCYEALNRAFSRYGTQSWARYIVNRESGCNPGAVNTTYSSWSQRAQCIAQMIPAVHRWVDYNRCKRDLRYAIQIFVHLSNGGTSTSPWAYY